MSAIGQGKSIDRLIDHSGHLSDIKQALLNGNGNVDMMSKVKSFIQSAGISSEDIKNFTLSALLLKLYNEHEGGDRNTIAGIMDTIKALGIGDKKADQFI